MPMLAEDQREVIAFLSRESTHGGQPVERIDTHSAIVFLTGDRALKLKRAVRYDYLDFSTARLRQRACEDEVRVNRRTAPDLYRGVVAVTREPHGTLALGGAGAPIDWLVDMRRFDQDGLLDRLAARGALDMALMEPLASSVAHLHRSAEPRMEHGGAAGMRWVVSGNAAGFEEEGRGLFDPQRCEELIAAAGAEIDRHATLLDRRRRDGFVRQCHGDLHLRNIVLLNDRPALFDAVEFNDEIACIDVFYDLAFLLMDLLRRRLLVHASRVLNGYLAETGDYEGLTLLPLFLSCRAAVRAKTSATTARLLGSTPRGQEAAALAREYLGMAVALLTPAPPRLVAIGGFSGTGKSTIALALAPHVGRPPGGVVLRTDVLRKTLAGVDAVERLASRAYTPEMNERVYRELESRARAILRTGHSAIADAVFARRADRRRLQALASDVGVRFDGLWLDAPEDVLVQRVSRRVRDASDADANVVRLQHAAAAEPVEWPHVDATPEPEAVTSVALRLLDPQGAPDAG